MNNNNNNSSSEELKLRVNAQEMSSIIIYREHRLSPSSSPATSTHTFTHTQTQAHTCIFVYIRVYLDDYIVRHLAMGDMLIIGLNSGLSYFSIA